MAILFQNITDFKKYVSGAVDNDESFLVAISSDINNAALQHVIPWLGSTLMHDVVIVFPNATGKEADLTKKIQAALAPLALYHASKTKNVKFGSEGMSKSENAAFRYQEADFREEMLVSGYENLEDMIRYLEDNANDFPNWSEKERHLSHFVRYASDFRMASTHRVNRYTFEFLIPIVDEVEYNLVERNIPQIAFDRLKTATNLTKKEREAVILLRKAIASCTVEEALRRQLVTLDKGRLIHNEAFGDQAGNRQTIPSLSYTEKAHSWEKVAANRLWQRFRDFIYANPSIFMYFFHETAYGTDTTTKGWGYVKPVTAKTEANKALEIEKLKKKKVVGF